MDSILIYQAANDLVQNTGTPFNLKWQRLEVMPNSQKPN